MPRRSKPKPKKAPPKVAPKLDTPYVPPDPDVLYRAGIASEQAKIIAIISVPWEEVVVYVDRVMVAANKAAADNLDNAPFWTGVCDAAQQFYRLRRKSIHRDLD